MKTMIHNILLGRGVASRKIHFVGIGGIGMSALARYCKARGSAVSGSDATRSDITDALRKEGIRIVIGHKKSNVDCHTAVIVYNRAISKDNPELREAKKLHIPAVPYAKVLGRITEEYKTIAITGSHGKSTTTAITGIILTKGGLDPTVLAGTNVKEFGNKNLRIGKNRYLVLEADDFGGAFWHYSPTHAIITNIDREHLDFYKNFAGVKRGFLKFVLRIRRGGTLILNRDDTGISNLKNKILKFAKNRDVRVVWYSLNDPAAKKIKKVIQIPGVHNTQNALAAYTLARTMKIPEKTILGAVHNFHGIWRRMEYKGKLKVKISNIKSQTSELFVFDDYAHHPTEIKATLQAFREKYPRSPLICVFQPHQAARLKALFKDFQSAFDDADIALITLAYNPTGRDVNDKKYDSEMLVKTIQEKYSKKRVFYLANLKNLKTALKILLISDGQHLTSNNPILIMMGAGDIVEETKKLLM